MQRSRTRDEVPRGSAGPGRAPALHEAGVVAHVRALHVMEGFPPPEGEPHPHDYRIELTAQSESLDEQGMVCDLDVLGVAVADVVRQLDGRDIRTVVDAPSSITVEVLARWIHRRVARWIPTRGVRSLAVRVWEHDGAFGGYRADLA